MSGLAFDRKQAIFIFFGVPWLSFLIKSTGVVQKGIRAQNGTRPVRF